MADGREHRRSPDLGLGPTALVCQHMGNSRLYSVNLPDDTRKELFRALRTQSTPEGRQPATGAPRTLLCAADARDHRGAGVDLWDNAFVYVVSPFTPQFKKKHITRKETIAGLHTPLWMARKHYAPNTPTPVIIGSDNTAAIRSLNGRIVLFDEETDALLLEVQRVYDDLQWTWKAISVEKQPADASRPFETVHMRGRHSYPREPPERVIRNSSPSASHTGETRQVPSHPRIV